MPAPLEGRGHPGDPAADGNGDDVDEDDDEDEVFASTDVHVEFDDD
ncbi:hypothetical protein [Streptomyces sp. AC495_CC817]|nr:hypothetical protein [Streptomyces sp. AC495_CC817]